MPWPRQGRPDHIRRAPATDAGTGGSGRRTHKHKCVCIVNDWKEPMERLLTSGTEGKSEGLSVGTCIITHAEEHWLSAMPTGGKTHMHTAHLMHRVTRTVGLMYGIIKKGPPRIPTEVGAPLCRRVGGCIRARGRASRAAVLMRSVIMPWNAYLPFSTEHEYDVP